MTPITVMNKDEGFHYLVGTVDENGEFWCHHETGDRAQAIRKAKDWNETGPKNRWTVVKQTVSFEEVYVPELAHETI